MKSKTPHALAGLALALLLALVGGASAATGGDSDDEPGEVVAASVTDDTSPVVADLGEKLAAETTPTEAPEPAPEPAPQPEPAPEPAPTTTAAPAPTYAAGSVEAIIEAYFGPNTSKALAVARCESGLNPGAVSPGGGNHGLFQINNVHSGKFEAVTGVPWSGRYDAEANTRFAKWLFDQSGWGPWACA